MAETPRRPPESNPPKTVKDKKCQFCHQPFTSSSLGRHLDVFIRENNPKPPDGVHDVEAIRKIRQNITRRQPRGAVARWGTPASVSAATPTTTSRKSPVSVDTGSPAAGSPVSQLGSSQLRVGLGRRHPSITHRETTGTVNDSTVRETEGGVSRAAMGDGVGQSPGQGPSQRSVSRQMLKQQLDLRRQIQDAMDTARAAELALRELISSLRATKQKADISSLPFTFDPLSLDFPALTLQCLESPPTLFASTQHPTATSWSIQPPGPSQLEALHAYFRGKFRQWKAACVSATAAATEELRYPSSQSTTKLDASEEILKVEREVERMEKHVHEHVQATYSIWSGLAQEQREHLWKLELARCLDKRRKDVDKLIEEVRLLRQDNANLRTQLDQAHRLQLPKEFRIAPPSTVFVDERLLARMQEDGSSGKGIVGLSLTDRQSDLNTIVSAAVERWKQVILSNRSVSTGLQTQRPLNAPDTTDVSQGVAGLSTTQPPSFPCRQQGFQEAPQPVSSRQHSLQMPQPPKAIAKSPRRAMSATSAVTAMTPPCPPAATTSSVAPSVSTHADDEDMNDQDVGTDKDAHEHADGGSDIDADGDADIDAEGDAEGETDADADADADMEDCPGPGGYTEAQRQPLAEQPPPHPLWVRSHNK